MPAEVSDLVGFGDGDTKVPKTPTPAEVPALVRELSRASAVHGNTIASMRKLLWTVVISVAFGSFGVMASVGMAGMWLGGQLSRIESIDRRVETLERSMSSRDDRIENVATMAGRNATLLEQSAETLREIREDLRQLRAAVH